MREVLDAVMRHLPKGLRYDIEGYLASVRAAAPALFEEAGLPHCENTLSNLLFLVALRKIWALVSGHYRIMRDSIHLVSESGELAVQMGSAEYSSQSDEYHGVQVLSDDFELVLRELGLFQFVTASGPREILLMLQEGCHNGV